MGGPEPRWCGAVSGLFFSFFSFLSFEIFKIIKWLSGIWQNVIHQLVGSVNNLYVDHTLTLC